MIVWRSDTVITFHRIEVKVAFTVIKKASHHRVAIPVTAAVTAPPMMVR
jgi:hypothetical protein